MSYEFPKLNTLIETINYGSHKMVPLFKSPLVGINNTLNICSMCIKAFPTETSLSMHMDGCKVPFLPIYEEEDFKISKIDNLEKKQLIAMLSICFIKNKTVFFEVENFDFFIIFDFEIFGYFSRFKNGNNSLSCVAVWPCFQNTGLGSLLIDYSQIRDADGVADFSIDELNANEPSANEPSAKGPEKPFSKKAIFCFRKFWKYKVIGAKTVNQISVERNIPVDDAIVGLELNGFDFKEWKMKGEIEVKKPRLLSRKVLRKNPLD